MLTHVMKKSFWDTLAWIAFAYLVVYALLKVAGVLHSPLPVDIGAVASVAYFIGKYAQKIDFSTKEMDFVKNDLKVVKSELSETKLNINRELNELKLGIAHISEDFHRRTAIRH